MKKRKLIKMNPYRKETKETDKSVSMGAPHQRIKVDKQQLRMTCALLFANKSSLNFTNVRKYNHNCWLDKPFEHNLCFNSKFTSDRAARQRNRITTVCIKCIGRVHVATFEFELNAEYVLEFVAFERKQTTESQWHGARHSAGTIE